MVMLPTIAPQGDFNVDTWDRRLGLGLIGANDYSKDDFPENFPFNRWNSQLQKYARYWYLVHGDIWLETKDRRLNDANEPNLRWPLQINYFREVALKHNDVLFGEVADSAGALVNIRVTPRPKYREDEAVKERAQQTERFLREVWMDNDGRSIQHENGIIEQILGGCVFKASWDPTDDDLEHQIRLEPVIPDFFAPVWDSRNPNKLLEAWVVWKMPAAEAKSKYGWKSSNPKQTQDPWYVEHYTEETITIKIGEMFLTVEDPQTGKKITYNEAPNPYKKVPFVYIPTERMGSFFGLSRVAGLEGLAKEMNSRIADMGDGLRENIHRDIYTRNVSGPIRTKDLPGRRAAIDLGVTPPGTSHMPEAFPIDPPQISTEMSKFTEYLRDEFGRQAFVPDVAEGEDEGSQRSALTLAFRMWPMTTRGRAERTHFTSGMVRLSKIIIRIAAEHGIGGMTLEHLKGVDLTCDWAPQIPRDREQVLNEVVLLVQINAMSPKTALKILEAVPDADEEHEEVIEWLKQQAEIQASANPQQQQGDKVKTQLQEPIAASGLDNK